MALILPNTIANGQDADGDKLQQNFATIEQYVNQQVVQADGSVAMTGPLLLSGAPTQPNQAATKAYVDSIGLLGEVKMYTGLAEPTNWRFCRGQALSRTTYAALFAIVGTRFGTGDGSTTFNLPNFQATLPVGFNSGTTVPSGVAGFTTLGGRGGTKDQIVVAHAHTVASHVHPINHNHAAGTTSSDSHTHNFRGEDGPPGTGSAFGLGRVADYEVTAFGVFGNTSSDTHSHTFDVAAYSGNSGAAAPATNSVGSDGTNDNYPPSLAINFIIKVL